MLVRLALERDIEGMAEMTREAMAETRPWLEYDDHEARDTFHSYLTTAEPTIFVAERDGRLVGMSVASIQQYRTASGLFVVQEVLFVRPEARGTRAAALLMKQIVAWSQGLGAREIISGNDSGLKSEQVARFFGRMGFSHVGYAMRRVF